MTASLDFKNLVCLISSRSKNDQSFFKEKKSKTGFQILHVVPFILYFLGDINITNKNVFFFFSAMSKLKQGNDLKLELT